MTHAPHPVAHPFTNIPANLDNPSHRSRQEPHAIAQQTAVGWIMDVGFRDRRIDPHFSAFLDFLFASDPENSIMNLVEYCRSECALDPRECLRVRNVLGTDTSEKSVDHVGSYFALDNVEASVPRVFQHEQSQSHLGWRSFPSSRCAIRPAPPQRFVHGIDELFVIQNLIGFFHPWLAAIVDVVP
jgi:hypothetical protein